MTDNQAKSGEELRRQLLERAGGQSTGEELRKQLLERTRGQIQNTAPQTPAGETEQESATESEQISAQTAGYPFTPETTGNTGMEAFEDYLEKNPEIADCVDRIELLMFLVADFEKLGMNSLPYKLGFNKQNLEQLYRAVATRIKNDLYTQEEFRLLMADKRSVTEIILKELLELNEGSPSERVERRTHEVKYAIGAFRDLMHLRNANVIADALADLYENPELTYEQLRAKSREYSAFPEDRPDQEIILDPTVIQQTLSTYVDKGVLSDEHAAIAAGTAQQPAIRSSDGLRFRPSAAQPAPAPQAAPQANIDANEIENNLSRETLNFLQTFDGIFRVGTDQYNAEFKGLFGGKTRVQITGELNGIKPRLGRRMLGIANTDDDIIDVIIDLYKPADNNEAIQIIADLYDELSQKYPKFAEDIKPELSDAEKAQATEDAYQAFKRLGGTS